MTAGPRALRAGTVGLVVIFAALAAAGAARAHTASPTIAVPTTPPPEDAGFPIVFAGNVTALEDGDADLEAKARPTGGAPCAPRPDDDPGSNIDLGAVLDQRRVTGAFSLTGSYVAPAPGDYVVCAWLEDDFNDWGPPAAATVTVRAPALQLTASAPATVVRRTPFGVTVSYQSEVPRYVTVLVVRASSCSISSDAVRTISASTFEVADDAAASGSGSLGTTVRIDDAGRYLVCGYFEEALFGTTAAQLVVHAATVVVTSGAPRLRFCGAAGGRKRVRSITARNVSCASAKALARRWGRRSVPPARLGAYRCSARSGRVTCTASGGRRVTFRFGRR